MRADWLAAVSDPAAYRREQDRLRFVWTFLGFTSDAPGENDWFRSTLGGRSVFVQRSKGGLHGFENRCAHRFYPIRTEDRGAGPILCGFHHWRYSPDGRAFGIPKCQDLFDALPVELGARLRPLQIATCGDLIFGRFPSDDFTEPLEDFLGPAFQILRSISAGSVHGLGNAVDVRANWRLCVHLALDDYHLAAVHPTTLGKNGYLDPQFVQYQRFGLHSAYIYSHGSYSIEDVSRACAEKSWSTMDYLLINIFPDFSILHLSVLDTYRFILASRSISVAHDRSRMINRMYPFVPGRDAPRLSGWKRALNNPVSKAVAMRIASSVQGRVMREDLGVAERLQETAPQVDGPPILGRFERRIEWYEEAYRSVVGPAAGDESTGEGRWQPGEDSNLRPSV